MQGGAWLLARPVAYLFGHRLFDRWEGVMPELRYQVAAADLGWSFALTFLAILTPLLFLLWRVSRLRWATVLLAILGALMLFAAVERFAPPVADWADATLAGLASPDADAIAEVAAPVGDGSEAASAGAALWLFRIGVLLMWLVAVASRWPDARSGPGGGTTGRLIAVYWQLVLVGVFLAAVLILDLVPWPIGMGHWVVLVALGLALVDRVRLRWGLFYFWHYLKLVALSTSLVYLGLARLVSCLD